jgi:hypothetical protein
MNVPTQSLRFLTQKLRAHRKASRTRWRVLSCHQQALMTLAHLRKGETYHDGRPDLRRGEQLRDVPHAVAQVLDEVAGVLEVDDGRDAVLVHGVQFLRALPLGAPRAGLAHGDLNPGNNPARRLQHDGPDGHDPKALVGDLAWDPWPLITQLGDWTTTTMPVSTLVERTRLVADLMGLDGPDRGLVHGPGARVRALGRRPGVVDELTGDDDLARPRLGTGRGHPGRRLTRRTGMALITGQNR